MAKNFRELYNKVNEKSKIYTSKLKFILFKNSQLLATYAKEQLLTGGTTRTKLKRRTGKLAASTKPIPIKITGNGYKTGIQFGTIYAKTHINTKLGIKTIIKPRNKKYLTIPLKSAMTAGGVLKGKARDESVFGETFIKKSKQGNLIIFGKRKFVRGAKAGQTGGKIVPLFLLRKKVGISSRISSQHLIQWIKPKINKDMKAIKV